MIYIEMTGRCGNQMFEYAIARKLQILNNNKDDIIFNTHYILSKAEVGEYWENALQYFNIVKVYEEDITNKSIYKYGKKMQKIIMKVYEKIFSKLPVKRNVKWKIQICFQPVMNKIGLYTACHGIGKIGKSIYKDKFVTGIYENRQWFDDIRDILVEELTPKEKVLQKNEKVLKIIQEKESVCLSVRRGDFVGTALRDVCTEEYYIKAIKKMKDIVPNAVFIVFSDDINWVKDNYKFMEDFIFEDGNDPIYEKFRLMYSCKHFIMSNSTFCWWAQYLCKNEKKKVVSPIRWMNESGYEDFIENEWVKIDL